MTPQELLTSILQKAIQGELVEQRAEEGTAEELFQQIQAEKKALIKVGLIKKEKALSAIVVEQIPFDIPSTWKWVKLGNILREVIVPMRDKPPFSKEGIPWCRIEDRDGFLLNGSKSNQLVSADTIQKMNLKVLPIGTVLSACTGGSIGTIVINTIECCTNQTFNGLVCSSGLYNWYLFWFLKTQFSALRKVGTGTTIAYVSQNKSREMLIPLPPLAEQKRIVAKLDEILPLLDRYEAAWNKLEEFNKRFPGDMQKSILHMAIQGKLVEQRSEEGAGEELFQQIKAEKQALIKSGKIKKEKPMPDIAEDEIPFDIPDTWKWVRLRNLCQTDISYGIIKLGNEDPRGVRVLRCSDVKENHIVPDFIRTVEASLSQQFSRTILQGGEIVINVRGTLGGCAVVPAEMRGYNVAREVAVIRQCEPIVAQYIVYLLMSGYFQQFMFHGLRGIAYKGLNMGTLALLPVPLPPLAEQKRIVAKLEEILPLCDRLK